MPDLHLVNQDSRVKGDSNEQKIVLSYDIFVSSGGNRL